MGKFGNTLMKRLSGYKEKGEHIQQIISGNLAKLINGNPTLVCDNKISRNAYSIYNSYSSKEMRKNIDFFYELDLKIASDKEIYNTLKAIIIYNIFPSIGITKEVPLYRARKFNFCDDDWNLCDKLVSKSELWLREPDKITNRGRLNDIGQPILYTSFDALTPIHEIRSKKDTQFALIKYGVKLNQKLNLSTICIDDSSTLTNFINNYDTWSKNGKENWKLVNSFVKNEFTKIVPEGKDYLYRSSIQMLKFFDKDECDGFIYPSVERGEGYNVAIRKQSIGKLGFVGLSYWRDDNDNLKKPKIDNFKCVRLWSNEINEDEIIYKEGERCEIEYKELSSNGHMWDGKLQIM